MGHLQDLASTLELGRDIPDTCFLATKPILYSLKIVAVLNHMCGSFLFQQFFFFFACWIMLGLAEQILLLGCTDVYSDSWAFTDGLNCITITYTFLATPPELRSWSNPIPEYCTVYILIYAYIYLYVCIYIYNIYILHVYIISMSMKLKISRS